MKDFKKRLQTIISRTNRSTYFKEIFLHLETHPEDSAIFWNHDKMQILILQILIQPFIGDYTDESMFMNQSNNENRNILQQSINMAMDGPQTMEKPQTMDRSQTINIQQPKVNMDKQQAKVNTSRPETMTMHSNTDSEKTVFKSDSSSDASPVVEKGQNNPTSRFLDAQRNNPFGNEPGTIFDAQMNNPFGNEAVSIFDTQRNNEPGTIFSGGQLKNKTFQNVITILNILQIIVNDPSIRLDFIKLHLPFYIYPYLNRPSLSKQSESLRIASLGVFGQLLKEKDTQILKYLMSTEMVPFCLKLMDIGTAISKKISIYIFYSIIQTEEGLEYACQTFERFIAITVILNSMCQQIYDQYEKSVTHSNKIFLDDEDFSPLLSPILDCYLRLARKPNVLMSFRTQPPDAIIDKRMSRLLGRSKEKYEQLKRVIEQVGVEK